MCMTDITGSRDANSVNGKLHYHGKNTNNISSYEVYKRLKGEKLIYQSKALISMQKDYLPAQIFTPSVVDSKELSILQNCVNSSSRGR